MDNKKRFYSTANELDELTEEGVFGEETQKLVAKRDTMSRNDYLFEILSEWNKTDQIGKDKVKYFIKDQYLDLYFKAFSVDPQGTVDMLTMFWYGSEDNPDLECFNSYLESAQLFSDVKSYLDDLVAKGNVKQSEKRRSRSLLLNSYSKNVELANKALAFLICIHKISAGNKDNINILEELNLTLFQKINSFNKLTNNKYSDLAGAIDRRVRNAEAHSNITFDDKSNSFVLRVQTKKKIKRVHISVDDMMMQVIPDINCFIQGFMYSGILLVLYVDDKSLYNKAMDSIINK